MRYEAEDGQLVFYLSRHSAKQQLPLVLYIQGTGCGSAFVEEKGRILSGVQSVLLEASHGLAVVTTVEKPGVRFLDDVAEAGDSKTCRPEFVSRYSLESWCNTLVRALRMARSSPGIDRSRTLLIGHSEGGIVAVRLSNMADGVTHVAALSGGGPTYLFHMSEFFRKKGLDPEKELYPCWNKILKDPTSTTRFCWGQTFQQWSSFMQTSIIQEALRSTSKLYFGHGTRDELNPITAFDVLRAELAAKGRAAVFDRVEGGNHGFDLPGEQPPGGFASMFRRILTWFGS
jgi:predicted esterase